MRVVLTNRSSRTRISCSELLTQSIYMYMHAEQTALSFIFHKKGEMQDNRNRYQGRVAAKADCKIACGPRNHSMHPLTIPCTDIHTHTDMCTCSIRKWRHSADCVQMRGSHPAHARIISLDAAASSCVPRVPIVGAPSRTNVAPAPLSNVSCTRLL